jgi:hypothetical protein
MASDASFVDYVCDQMRDAGSISSRKMFGEFALYCDGKVVPVEAPPYPGAKPYFLITDRVDDREWLGGLIAATALELPDPKPKKSARR